MIDTISLSAHLHSPLSLSLIFSNVILLKAQHRFLFQVEQIQTEYKKLALDLHPDKNSGDKEAEAKFQKLKVIPISFRSFLFRFIHHRNSAYNENHHSHIT